MNNDPVFTTLEATTDNKVWWRSKTIWLNLLAVLSMILPAVGQWVKDNPVDFIGALGALNVLVRFATRGKVTVFTDDNDASGNGSSAGMGAGGGKPGDGSGHGLGDISKRQRMSGFPWLVVSACVALLVVMVLTGCNPAAWSQAAAMWDAKAVITHTDPDSGNSASVIIRPRRVVEEKANRSDGRYGPDLGSRMREAFTWDHRRDYRPRRLAQSPAISVMP